VIVATKQQMKEAHAFAASLLSYAYSVADMQIDTMMALVTGSVMFNGRGRDIDIVLGPVCLDDVLDNNKLTAIHDELVHTLGCTVTSHYGIIGEEPGDKGFKMHCYRKGIYNILLVDRGVENWALAREVCEALAKTLGPISKRQRVAVHKVLVDGMDANEGAALTLRQVTEDYT